MERLKLTEEQKTFFYNYFLYLFAKQGSIFPGQDIAPLMDEMQALYDKASAEALKIKAFLK